MILFHLFVLENCRAKELFVENAEQVKEMVKVLDCELQEDYLYRI